MTCECGEPKSRRAKRCKPCYEARGGPLVDAVVRWYPERSAAEIAAEIGTSEMAVYNTASRLRRTNPGLIAYRDPSQNAGSFGKRPWARAHA